MTDHKATIAKTLASFGYGPTDNVTLHEGQLVYFCGPVGRRLFRLGREGRLDWLQPHGEKVVFVPDASGTLHQDLSTRLAKRRGRSFVS